MWFFLNRHRFGAHVYLTGDNVESARLMGVNVDRTKIAHLRNRRGRPRPSPGSS